MSRELLGDRLRRRVRPLLPVGTIRRSVVREVYYRGRIVSEVAATGTGALLLGLVASGAAVVIGASAVVVSVALGSSAVVWPLPLAPGERPVS